MVEIPLFSFLNLYLQTIVGKGEAFGQSFAGIPMKTYIVRGVYKIGATSPYLAGKADGIVNELMAMVDAFEAQSVDHERVHSFQIRQLFVTDGFHIGDIDQWSEAIAQYRQLVVHHFYGHDGDVANGERLVLLYGVEGQSRHTGIELRLKAIGHHGMDATHCLTVGIDIDALLEGVRTQVVYSAHMVVMAMGDENAVDGSYGLR